MKTDRENKIAQVSKEMFCVAFSAEKLKRQIARLMESNQQLQHHFACDINNTIPSATSATHMMKLHFFSDPGELR